jgi:NADPH:quinone reductase-like Zn-dependent oxidoreductase
MAAASPPMYGPNSTHKHQDILLTDNQRPDDGSFAETILFKDGHLALLPDNLTFEAAAGLATNLTTIGQAFYLLLQLPLPGKPNPKETPILIHGAGTSTGTMAIQMAKLSGLQVIATCSPSSADLVKSRGADHIFDYKDPECGAKIRTLTNDDMHKALDCVGGDDSIRICGEALSSKCNNWVTNIVSMFPVGKVREGVSAQAMLAYTSFGEEFVRSSGRYFPPMPGHFEHGVKMWKLISSFIAEGKVKPHPHTVGANGLEGIADGLQALRDKTHKGMRLVYRIADTPGLATKDEAVSGQWGQNGLWGE